MITKPEVRSVVLGKLDLPGGGRAVGRRRRQRERRHRGRPGRPRPAGRRRRARPRRRRAGPGQRRRPRCCGRRGGGRRPRRPRRACPPPTASSSAAAASTCSTPASPPSAPVAGWSPPSPPSTGPRPPTAGSGTWSRWASTGPRPSPTAASASRPTTRCSWRGATRRWRRAPTTTAGDGSSSASAARRRPPPTRWRRSSPKPWPRPASPTAEAFATVDRPRPATRPCPTGAITFPSSLLGAGRRPQPERGGRRRGRAPPAWPRPPPCWPPVPADAWSSPSVKGATATAPRPWPWARVGGPGSVHVVGLGPGRRPPTARRLPPPPSARPTRSSATGPTSTPSAPLLRPDQLVLRGTMGAEADRALAALPWPPCGWRVALVSSGDAGRVRHGRPHPASWPTADVAIELVPGVTAAHAAGRRRRRPPRPAPTPSSPSPTCTFRGDYRRPAAGGGRRPAWPSPSTTPAPPAVPTTWPGPGTCWPRCSTRPRPSWSSPTPPAPTSRLSAPTLAALDPTIVGMRSMVLVGRPPQ